MTGNANIDRDDPNVYDPFNPPPKTATRSRPRAIRFRCELCGGQLQAFGVLDVGTVERNHLATCPDRLAR